MPLQPLALLNGDWLYVLVLPHVVRRQSSAEGSGDG